MAHRLGFPARQLIGRTLQPVFVQTGIVAAPGGGNWNTGATWVGGVAPTAADNVYLLGTSGNVTIPTATTVLCRSLDCTGYTGTLTFATSTSSLNIGDAAGGACTFVPGMTLTLTGTGTITFVATAASTTYQFTSGTKALPNVTFSTGASTTIEFADDLTFATSGTFALTSGIVDTNSKSVTLPTGQFILSGTTARTLTLGSSPIAISATWVATTSTNLTITANTAVVTQNNAGANFAGGGVDYNGMTLIQTGSGTAAITGANTFGALTRTGTAALSDSLQFSADQTVAGALTLTGNSAANRLWVQSNTVGTPRTITCNGTHTVTRADFEDIVGAGSVSWNLAAATGGSGDCGGNSGITFTTATTAYGVVAGNWSDTATWSTGSGGAGGAPVPLPQDTVRLDPSSAAGTYIMDMARHAKDVICTGFTRTLSLATSATARYLFGSLTLDTGMTFTATGNLVFAGRGSHTLTMAGKAFTGAAGRSITFGRFGGTYTLQDAADFGSVSSNGLITAGGGTFDANVFNVSAWLFNLGTSTVNMGTGIWTVLATSGTVWTAAAGTTVNASTSSVVIGATSASSRTFAGGGKTYATLTHTVAGSTGTLVITGSNTFDTINFSDVTNARTLSFTAATTTTITGSFNVQGTATKLMTIGSVTAADHNLSKAAGVVSCDYLSISHSQAAGGASWYAGANSNDGLNNAGWVFAAAPVAPVIRRSVIVGGVVAVQRSTSW